MYLSMLKQEALGAVDVADGLAGAGNWDPAEMAL